MLAAFVLAGGGIGALSCGTSTASDLRPRLECPRAARSPVAAAPDLGSLEAITDAVEAGRGLPEVVRAAAAALDASLVLIDRSSACSRWPPARAPTSAR